MKKGVILSVDKHFLTLLTPEGEFHRSKKEEKFYEIGKEIYFSPYEFKRSKSLQRFYTRAALVSAIVSILLILSFLPSYFNEKVFAYVTIDINPSIELSLNENLRVVDLYGINPEGLIVIEKIKDWKETDVTLMTNMIVKATKDSGYAENKQQILVSATLLEDNKVLTKKLDKKLEKISKQRVVPEADVKIMKATVKERSKAKEQGISTGTYIENKRKKEEKKEQDTEEKSTPSRLKKTPMPSENRVPVENRRATPISETPNKIKSADVIPSSKTPKSADVVSGSKTLRKTKSAKSQTPAIKAKIPKVMEVKKAESTVKQKGNGQPKAKQQLNKHMTKENKRSSQTNQMKKEIPKKHQNIKEEKHKHPSNKKVNQKNKPIHHKKQPDFNHKERMEREHNHERGNGKRENRTPHKQF